MSDGRSPAPAFEGLAILVDAEEAGWADWLGTDPEALVRRAVAAALRGGGLRPDYRGEVGVTLSGDEAVRALNAKWRGKDAATNVLSFPGAPVTPGERPPPLMGDLVLALGVCRREAREEDKTPADHFSHLLVHGTLHLLGYDHGEEPEAERMERLEVEILATLSIADPYREAAQPLSPEPVG